ncbi:MAG: hypothetical protein HY897_19765 [Deltaproteobacteria bacterium]|nr:hypothetical protein [Deltaproteobacteria bacterium]
MRIDSPKTRLKRDLRRLFRNMDFTCRRNDERFAEIYLQLGWAWEFLALQCRHWDGFRRTREGHDACRICGKIKGTDDGWFLFPSKGPVTLGQKRFPHKRRDCPDKKAAMIDAGTIRFHGAKLSVEVHDGYKTNWPGSKHAMNIAADRIVRVIEGDVECWLDSHLVHVKWKRPDGRRRKPVYGGFPWELPKKLLRKFPVILEHADRGRLVGVNILISPHPRRKR